MFIYAIIIGLIIGTIRIGKFEKLGYVKIKYSLMIFIGILLQISIFILNIGMARINNNLSVVLILLSYTFIIISLIANISIKYIFIVLTGSLFNFIMMILNGIKIGITADAANKAFSPEIVKLLKTGDIVYFKIIAEEKFFMGGFIPIKSFLVYPTVLTIGDIIIFLGIILVIQNIMIDKNIRKGRNIKYSKYLFR